MSQVLVGLHRVGVVGLRQACEKASAAGLVGREVIVSFLVDELAADNFIPEAQAGDYRIALWREYLRFVGEDFSDYFSEIPVMVRGEPGEDRDRLVDLCDTALAEFELRPVVEFVGAARDGPNLQLVIGGTTVAQGVPSLRSLKATVRQRLSDW